MSHEKKTVVIGRFGKTHGLKGWLRVSSETSPKENILDYQPWQVCLKTGSQDLKVTGSMRQADVLLVHIEGYDSPDTAKQLTGQFIQVSRELLPDLKAQEYYWADLEGLSVVNLAQEEFGKVDYLMEAGACDVLVVKGENEYLIPFDRNNVVKEVDLSTKKIVVDWDPEL